jgi:hypothetical protein
MIARKPIRILFWVLGFLAVLVVWAAMSAHETNKLKPPATVRTVQDFLQQMPAPARVRTFTFSGGNYYEVWGQMGSTVRLPSGSPSYIFDPNGRLVDWTSDRGDAGNYTRKWGHFKDARFISMEQMLQALGATSAPPKGGMP